MNKLILPITILLTSIILGGFFYASQVNKQRSIEKQQQVKLEIEKEQEERDYIAKRTLDCLKIFESTDKKFNNVKGWQYHEPTDRSSALARLAGVYDDVCRIKYIDNSTGDYFYKTF